MDFVATHSYLFAVLLGLPLVVIAIATAGQHRASVLIAGSIELIHSPPAPLFDEVYWRPNRLGGVAWGIEDMVLCFSLGATVWFAAIVPYRSRLTLRIETRRIILGLLAIGLPSAMLGLMLDVHLTTRMEAIVATMIATAIVLGTLRPGLLRLSAAAVLLYTTYYVAFLLVCDLLIPDFFGMWDGPELWGVYLWGIPADEVAFIVAFSACYPLIVGTVLDAGFARHGSAFRPASPAR